MTVNVKQAKRRELQFHSLQDLSDDIQALVEAPNVTSAGNWSPGQNVWHVASVIDWSMNGFPFKAPLPMRILGPLLRSRVLKKIDPGVKPPASIAKHFEAGKDKSLDEALVYLNQVVDQASKPGAMKISSPIFGKLTHEQWETLHCRHAELHFGFLFAE